MTLFNAFYKFLKKRHKKTARFQLLVAVGQKLVLEYRFSWPYMDWWDEDAFNRYLERFDELTHFNTDRRFMLYQIMRLVEEVPGDTVECGSLEGAGSYLMLLLNEQSTQHARWHHVFDSFEGLSSPESIDGEHWSKGDLSVSMERVGSSLSISDRVTLYKGWIPTRSPELEDRRFAFVHKDVDLYQPTRDSIDFFYSRLSDGGIILCDDYGSGLCPGATRAIDEFLADKPEKWCICTAAARFMIKNRATAASLKLAS